MWGGVGVGQAHCGPLQLRLSQCGPISLFRTNGCLWPSHRPEVALLGLWSQQEGCCTCRPWPVSSMSSSHPRTPCEVLEPPFLSHAPITPFLDLPPQSPATLRTRLGLVPHCPLCRVRNRGSDRARTPVSLPQWGDQGAPFLRHLTVSHRHHHCLVSECSHHPKRSPVPINRHPHAPPHSCWQPRICFPARWVCPS